jgi:hypothetical protein
MFDRTDEHGDAIGRAMNSLASMEIGDTYTHEQSAADLGCEYLSADWDYRIGQVKDMALDELRIQLVSVRGVGYRLGDGDDTFGHVRGRLKRAGRQFKRAERTLDCVRDDVYSEHQLFVRNAKRDAIAEQRKAIYREQSLIARLLRPTKTEPRMAAC